MPGIDVGVTSRAPYQLMRKIMGAYTGQKTEGLPVVAKTIAPAKHLLIDYAAVQPLEQVSYAKYRITLWLCATVLLSSVLVWISMSLVRRLRPTKTATPAKPIKRRRLPAVAKFVAGVNSLFCAVYLFVLLLTPEALEFIAVNGLPESLPFPQSMLIYIPLLSIVLTAVIVILSISAWIRKYWTVAERLHYTLLTAALVVFTWLSFTLNLMPTLSSVPCGSLKAGGFGDGCIPIAKW